MDFAQLALLTFAIIMMILGVILAFVPFLPGSVIIWMIAVAAGFIDGFAHITPPALFIITGLMIASATSNFGLPALGIKSGHLSCSAAVGALVGGLVGTFAMPIPILGTLAGTIAGALVVELPFSRRARPALQAGQTAATLFVTSYIFELAVTFAIFLVLVTSILSAR
ncbi:MAG: DUF456 domain-containing protein [Aggregatilineales bacterium]